MAEPVRSIDRLDTTPRFTQQDVDQLNARFVGVDSPTMLATMLREKLVGNVAVVSSFGAESIVLLHLLAQVDRHIPVIFLDTGKHFPETITYRQIIEDRLGLTQILTFSPDPAAITAKDGTGLRWSYDPDGCCAIRKVEPLARALAPFDGSITGRKGFQSATRVGLPRFELEGDKIKINPLADWDKAQIDAYFITHDLPAHPLVEQGYPSIGCAPCTSRVLPGEDPRAGRWRGWDKVECGIHGSSDLPPADSDPVF